MRVFLFNTHFFSWPVLKLAALQFIGSLLHDGGPVIDSMRLNLAVERLVNQALTHTAYTPHVIFVCRFDDCHVTLVCIRVGRRRLLRALTYLSAVGMNLRY